MGIVWAICGHCMDTWGQLRLSQLSRCLGNVWAIGRAIGQYGLDISALLDQYVLFQTDNSCLLVSCDGISEEIENATYMLDNVSHYINF